MALGAYTALRTYARWEETERALRLGRPLPLLRMGRVAALGVALAALAAVILLLLHP
jgi:uncharacterized membrane protein YidH (DUF202 family)